MRRALLALVCLAAAASVFLLPRADPARLAALDAHQLLRVAPAGSERPIGAEILDGPAVIARGEGTATLSIYGTLLAADPPSEDLNVHLHARRSVIRGLRKVAAEQGLSLSVEGEHVATDSARGRGANFVVMYDAGAQRLSLEYTHASGVRRVVHLPWTPPQRSSLFPPVVAILLAVLFRRPLIALFSGVWIGALLLRLHEGSGVAAALAWSLPDVVTRGLWPEVWDAEAGALNAGRGKIVGFVVAMLAMVGVMTKSGGIRGLVDSVAKLARSVRSTQIATWLMGLVVFFDDYANCILVGTTMRPLTDRFRISREKLAYLVDSTAAPVAGISIFSTWIAFEVSTFAPQLPAAGLTSDQGYAVFLQTLPFRFYCLFTLLLAGLVVVTGRDFGPMLAAERRARSTGKLVRDGGKPMVGEEATSLEPAPGVVPRARNALLPILVFVAVTIEEILRVGLAAHDELTLRGSLRSLEAFTQVLTDGDSSRAILVGSCSGLAVALLLALAAGAGREIPRAVAVTLRNMGIAIAILYLAWMIGAACESLGTAPYLTELLGDALAPQLLPMLLFLLAAAISFATGTSWGTMSILLPLVVGLAYVLGEQRLPDGTAFGGPALMVMSIGAVLEGAIFGDHCSPISDTTILSSTASASDHIDHTRTQMVYALTTMAVALLAGYFPCAMLGWSPWAALAAGAALLVVLVLAFGRQSDAPAT
jgi:Na+/H+ antiporter NhaC